VWAGFEQEPFWHIIVTNRFSQVIFNRMEKAARPTTKLGRLKAHLDRWGVMRTLYNLIMIGAGRILGINVFVVRHREMEEEPDYPSTLPGLDIRVMTTQELREAAKEAELGLSSEFVEAAIDRGDLAIAAFDGDVLAAYVWRSQTSAPHTDTVWVRVKKPCSYSYNSFTRPGYRGKHISPVIHLSSDTEMIKLGYKYRAGFVAVTNFASLAAGKSMGTQVIGHIAYVEWFGRLFLFRAKAIKEIGFEFFRPE
jgi:hypothetical protein